ncbi:MAG: MAPEG family protein [Parvibaculales bacterium]
MVETYSSALTGIWVIIITVMVQALVASIAHRRQNKYIPGIVDAHLGHESFVFRSDRTFRNSLENIVPMLALSFMAIMLELDPGRLANIVWVYAAARIVFTGLYYAIATEKNPSPRSYFFIIAFIANIILAVDVGRALL